MIVRDISGGRQRDTRECADAGTPQGCAAIHKHHIKKMITRRFIEVKCYIFTNTRLAIICSIFLITATAGAQPSCCNAGNEKPIILKGLSIGMDIDKARDICVSLLGKDWSVSQIDAREKLLNDYLESFRQDKMPAIGKHGFLIKHKGGYIFGYGFISDEGTGKITQITFSSELTEYIFSVKDIHTDDFVEQLCETFGLSELPWIMNGWFYSSPLGYDLTIMTSKTMDIKKRKINEKNRNVRKIQFN